MSEQKPEKKKRRTMPKAALPEDSAMASTVFTPAVLVAHAGSGSRLKSTHPSRDESGQRVKETPVGGLVTTEAAAATKPFRRKDPGSRSHNSRKRSRERKQPGSQPSRRKLSMSSAAVGFSPANTFTRGSKRRASQCVSAMVQRAGAGKRILRPTVIADRSGDRSTAPAPSVMLPTMASSTHRPAKGVVASVAELYGFDVPKRVKKMYSIIRSAAGALGGAAAGGAIYGEVTMTSFHRLVYYLESLEGPCQLTAASSFLDVGAGLGKPNLHVASHTGCVSVGVEMIGARWWRSLAVLRSVISRAPGTPPPLFVHADVLDCDLSSFTHVYAFDRGFPPETLRKMFEKFTRSVYAQVLVCYQQPKHAHSLGLAAPAVRRFTMKMAGSGEQHSCWVYIKQTRPSSTLAKEGLSLLRGWTFPTFPTGSTVLDSPVSHGESYLSAASVAAAAIEDVKAPGSSTAEHRPLQEYYLWVVDQQGLARCCRSKRQRVPLRR